MIRKSMMGLAFAALATVAGAQTEQKFKPVTDPSLLDQDDPLGLQIYQAKLRSVRDCDPEFDIPDSAAKRHDMLVSLRKNPDDMLDSIRLLGLASDGGISICFDKALQATPYQAVIYMIWPGWISLRPDAPVTALQSALNNYAERSVKANTGALTAEEWATPHGILDHGVTNAAPPPVRTQRIPSPVAAAASATP